MDQTDLSCYLRDLILECPWGINISCDATRLRIHYKNRAGIELKPPRTYWSRVCRTLSFTMSISMLRYFVLCLGLRSTGNFSKWIEIPRMRHNYRSWPPWWTSQSLSNYLPVIETVKKIKCPLSESSLHWNEHTNVEWLTVQNKAMNLREHSD